MLKRLVIKAWETLWEQWNARSVRLVNLVRDYVEEGWKRFPGGWIRPVGPPYFIWIVQHSVKLVDDMVSFFTDFLTLTIPLIGASLILDEFVVDKKLRQRVMTLDQVALFPIRVIIDLGLRKAQEQLPRDFQIADKALKLETLFILIKTGSLKALTKLLLGTVWKRVLIIIFLVVKWSAAVGYLILLYRYVQILDNPVQSSLWFSAKLSDDNPRQNQHPRKVRRRLGGVNP